MKHWRNAFLHNNNIEAYKEVQSFFTLPSKVKGEEIVKHFPLDEQKYVRDELNSLVSLYRQDRRQYSKMITEGQAIIWDAILRCYLEICDLGKRFDQHFCTLYPNSYLKSASNLTIVCDIYAKMQVRISELEKVLGIDRFLDRVSDDTFQILDEILQKYRDKLNQITVAHKSHFQQNWNTTSVAKVIYHKLLNPVDSDAICDLFRSGQKQVILFVIDGFGFCQYLWHSHLGEYEKAFTYDENLFRWLTKAEALRCFPIGSSYITDTAAGLSQIFIGQSSKETGVIASKYHNPGVGTQVTETKRISPVEFQNVFTTKWNCMFDVLMPYDIDAKVYYCSQYPDSVSGFSKFIFGGARVDEVVPSERLFAYLKTDIDNGLTEGLQVVYHTGIDNSGHTMGAYSKFERYEHDKLDGLLRNFLVELAETHPDLFNGERSILITADHGMTESAKLMIDRYTLRNVLNRAGIRAPIIIEDNRALLIYNIDNGQVVDAKASLIEYFKIERIAVDVICYTDSQFQKFFSTDKNDKRSKIMPQLVVRLIDNGLFYSNTRVNPHLLHYGGHGGASTDEVFVPLIDIPH